MWLVFLFACANSADVSPVVQKLPEKGDSLTDDQQQPEKPEPPENSIPTYKPDDLITLSGTVEYYGESKGTIFMEVLQNDPESREPQLLQQDTLPLLGEFSMKAPKNTKGLNLMIYIDLTGDQISGEDPRGYYEFETTTEDITGAKITILDEKEMIKTKDPGHGKEGKKDEKDPEKKPE